MADWSAGAFLNFIDETGQIGGTGAVNNMQILGLTDFPSPAKLIPSPMPIRGQ
jgi:hypothetical protein